MIESNHLSKESLELRDYMSMISERCWHAGWLIELEYTLWSIINTGPTGDSSMDVTQKDIDKLLELSKKCNGWIVYLSSTDPNHYHLIPIRKWIDHFDDRSNNPLNIAELYSSQNHASKFTGIFEEEEFSPLIKRSLLLFDDVILAKLPDIRPTPLGIVHYINGSDDFGDFELDKYGWLIEGELIKKYEVSYHDAIGNEEEHEIINKFLNFPEETKKMLTKRIAATQLKRLHGIDSFPAFSNSHRFFEKDFAQKNTVLRIVLNKLPIPSDLTSWDEIKEFKDNPENIGRFLALKELVNQISHSALHPSEIVDKIDYLFYQYEKSFKLHKLEYNRGNMEIFVVTPLEIIEDLVKFKWSKLAKTLFSIDKNDISLLKSEINLPGSQVAYIFHAKDYFSE